MKKMKNVLLASLLLVGSSSFAQVETISADGKADKFSLSEAALKSGSFYEHMLIVDVTGNGFADKTTVYFTENNATPGFDPEYDAFKLKGNSNQPMIYTLAGTVKLSINGQNVDGFEQQIPMGFEAGTNGDFTFFFQDAETFPNTSLIYLEDTKTGTFTDLRAKTTYTFNSLTTDNAKRFVLHFSLPMTITPTAAGCEGFGSVAFDQPGVNEWTWILMDDGGDAVASSNQFNEFSAVGGLAPGSYELILNNGTGYITSEMIDITGVLPVIAWFDANKTTVEVGESVTFTDLSTGANNWEWNFGDGTPTVFGNATVSHTYTTPGTYTITLNATNNDCNAAATKTVTVNKTVSSIANVIDGDFKVYSNNNGILVEWRNVENAAGTSVNVYNTIGQTVVTPKALEASTGKVQIELPSNESGIYLVNINNAQGASREFKLLVNKN